MEYTDYWQCVTECGCVDKPCCFAEDEDGAVHSHCPRGSGVGILLRMTQKDFEKRFNQNQQTKTE